MNAVEFRDLVNTVADAWNEADTVSAADCFADDAIYMEPPDRHFFQGRVQLLALFSMLHPGNNMQWHHIWFDEQSQVGAGEFTFAHDQVHGVAIIEVEEQKIKLWREYQWHGHMSWQRFIAHENKTFQCTIDNSPFLLLHETVIPGH
jgi:ketosteroid isomerase-like protein